MKGKNVRDEIYEAKCPSHIVFGDPLYFDEYKDRLDELVIDYRPPKTFELRVVLEERYTSIFPRCTYLRAALYMAPAETMNVYLQGKKYDVQKLAEKEIGLDTGRYLLDVDGRDDEIDVGANIVCGRLTELYRIDVATGKRIVDAAIITLELPDDMSIEKLRTQASYFFEDMQQVEQKEPEKRRGQQELSR